MATATFDMHPSVERVWGWVSDPWKCRNCGQSFSPHERKEFRWVRREEAYEHKDLRKCLQQMRRTMWQNMAILRGEIAAAKPKVVRKRRKR